MSNFAQLFVAEDRVWSERPSVIVYYLANGYTDGSGPAEEAIILQATTGGIPSTYTATVAGGGSIQLPLDEVRIIQRINNTQWKFAARYAMRYIDTFAFDTAGEQQHIRQSLGTSAYGSNASNTISGLIDDDGERVNGCDILVPAFSWQMTTYLDATQFSCKDLAYLTNGVNSTAFPNNGPTQFSAGEVMFMGVQGQARGPLSKWELTLKFSARPNYDGVSRDTLTIGVAPYQIASITKLGWEYLWTRYKPAQVNGKMVNVPDQVFCEQVYEYFDLNTLFPNNTPPPFPN